MAFINHHKMLPPAINFSLSCLLSFRVLCHIYCSSAHIMTCQSLSFQTANHLGTSVKNRHPFVRWRTIAPMYSSNYIKLSRMLQSLRAVQDDIEYQPVPILFDSSNNLHRDIRYHPEQPSRIQKCVEAIRKRYDTSEPCPVVLVDVATEPSPDSSSSSPLSKKNCNTLLHVHEPFTDIELDYARSILVKTHSQEYVSNLETTCRRAKQRRIVEGKNPLGFSGYVDADTFLTTETYDVCLRATAAWIRCVNSTCPPRNSSSKESQHPAAAAFALTRPPGHHATQTESNGFCFFNFAAAAAIHAIHSGLANKVSILDWDVHYGQGVADIIQIYPNIRYVSIHQSPAFPYQGTRREIVGQYKNILTIPLSPDSSWSCGYQTAFEDHAMPFVINATVSSTPEDDKDRGWIPELVIVCAGYDALLSDELASCNLNAVDYGTMTRMLKDRLGHEIGIVMGLEGGYQLDDDASGGNLPDAVLKTIHELHTRPEIVF